MLFRLQLALIIEMSKWLFAKLEVEKLFIKQIMLSGLAITVLDV